MSKMEKPPIGLKPRSIFMKERLGEVRGAISRYFNAGLQIDIEWIQEYNELIFKIKKQK